MFPKDWTQPCGKCCTKKYAGVFQIPWRIFCKKGCSADGDSWDECLEACNDLCYKDPVLKDRQWTYFIDRSPGDDNYSLVYNDSKKIESCKKEKAQNVSMLVLLAVVSRVAMRKPSNRFTSPEQHTLITLILRKFGIPAEKVEQVQPNRPQPPPLPPPPLPRPNKSTSTDDEVRASDGLPGTSA